MSWEFRRKLVYLLAAFVVVTGVTVFLLRDTIFPAPTCTDHKQNGFEVGVDCGGNCAIRCSQEVSPLTVLFAKSIRSSNGRYDIVGMVNNNNINNASQQITYVFTLYDSFGKVIATLDGNTIAPLGGKFPIILQSIPLDKAPTNVTLTIKDGPHYLVKEVPSSPTIKVLERRYEVGSVPRVYATISNTKHVELSKLPVRVLLFDEQDNVYAVGQTIVPFLDKEGVKEIIFTWDEPLPVAPTRIGIYPIFNPFDAIGY